MTMIFTRKSLKLLNYRLRCLTSFSSGQKRSVQSTANGEAPSVEVNFSNG